MIYLTKFSSLDNIIEQYKTICSNTNGPVMKWIIYDSDSQTEKLILQKHKDYIENGGSKKNMKILFITTKI